MGAGFSTVTPSGGSVNVTSVAQVVWSYTPRSLTDIQSLVTAIQNNDPGAVPSYADLQYVPVPYYAGQVTADQAAAFIDNAIRNYGLAGAFANFIANNPYNLWTTNFVSQVAINPYLTATSLNMIILQSAMSGNGAQLILYQLAQNYYYNMWIYTVTASAPSSITFSTNVTLSTNVLIAQNITIASGVAVTCTTTCFFVAQSFNNYGTVVNQNGAGGGAPPPGAGPGGAGGGGIVVVAITAALGTLNVSGNNGVNASGPAYSNVGGAGGTGVFYIVSGVTVPVGGTGDYNGGKPSYNGGGGGGVTNYAGGAGGNSVVYSFSSPNAMVTYILQGLSDWWLINVVGKAPSLTTPLLTFHGSGGGSGSDLSGYASAAGGGGGGGEMVVYGYDILSGTLKAAGGNGGNATAAAGYVAGGGGGGAGGLVFVFYGATSGSVTANIAGGAGGLGSTSPANGLSGSTGVLYIAQVTVNR